MAQIAPIDERTLAFRAREQFVAWDGYREALLAHDALTGRRSELPCSRCRCFISVQDLAAGPDARPLCPRCDELERGDSPPDLA